MRHRQTTKLFTSCGTGFEVNLDLVEYISILGPWRRDSEGYIITRDGKMLLREIYKYKHPYDDIRGLQIDHIDGQKEHCYIENARKLTGYGNNQNKRKNPEQKYDGVFDKGNGFFSCIINDIEFFINSDDFICAKVYDSIVYYIYGPVIYLNGKGKNSWVEDPVLYVPDALENWGLSNFLMVKIEEIKNDKKYQGVTKSSKGWKAQEGGRVIGHFDTPEEAARHIDYLRINSCSWDNLIFPVENYTQLIESTRFMITFKLKRLNKADTLVFTKKSSPVEDEAVHVEDVKDDHVDDVKEEQNIPIKESAVAPATKLTKEENSESEEVKETPTKESPIISRKTYVSSEESDDQLPKFASLVRKISGIEMPLHLTLDQWETETLVRFLRLFFEVFFRLDPRRQSKRTNCTDCIERLLNCYFGRTLGKLNNFERESVNNTYELIGIDVGKTGDPFCKGICPRFIEKYVEVKNIGPTRKK